jgi:MinD-like ATPase involved in chromosome partitioning or flagellar assembly
MSASEGETIGILLALIPEEQRAFTELITPANPAAQGLQILTTTRDAHDLLDDIRQYKPQLVVVSPNTRNYDAALIRQMAEWPEAPIAVVGVVPREGTYGSEMTAQGALAFYTTPVTPAIVEQFMHAAPRFVADARGRWQAPLAASGVDKKITAAVGATAYKSGSVVVYSVKGGDGKTTLAVNLACLLAYVGGKKTLLIDGNMNGGNVVIHLNVAPGDCTIAHLAADFARSGGRLEPAMIRRRAMPVDRHIDPRTNRAESSLDVVFGITSIEQAGHEGLDGDNGLRFMAELLRQARDLYDFVVVDLGSNTHLGPHWGALTAADLVLLLCISDKASLHFNRTTLEPLLDPQRGVLRQEKIRLIVNRYDARDRIDLKDVADFFHLPVVATIGEDPTRAVQQSINLGRPFVLDHLGPANDPATEATLQSLLRVTEEIFPPIGQISQARQTRRGGGLLGGLLGGRR